MTSVYVESETPASWYDLEKSCSASRGHLVSLSDEVLEAALADEAEVFSYWSGGNICPNSPGTKSV